MLLDWGFGANNHLTDLTSGQDSQFLILGVVLGAVWFLLTLMFVYYLVQFIRTRSQTKIYGRTMLYINLAFAVVELIDWILVIVFWNNGSKIFDSPNQDYQTVVALVVIGFVVLVSIIIMMWFFLPYYGIAFDDHRILFMGEDIPYKSITKIVIDEKTRDTYVNYTRGKRAHKRLKFSASSAFGLFVQKNATLTGHAATEADERTYFKTLVTQDRASEKQLDKDINNKLKDKNKDK